MKDHRTALITGATSGIGKAIAFKLAEKGFNLIITGRRKAILDDIKEIITSQYNVDVLTLSFNVGNRNQVEEAFSEINRFYKKIDILINNAGLALGLTAIDEGDISDWEIMLDTNVKGILYMTKNALPLLKKSNNPQIINIGSIAGRETYPNGNVYCATKHAVDSLSKAMRIDLLKYDIKVSQVCPGAVETEFSMVRFKGDKEKASSVYNGFKPLTPEDISHIIGFIIDLPLHVNINDILIMPTQQANTSIINKKTI